VATDDEADLVRRAQQRDVRAFEQLYRLHVPRVYALCLRLTANVRRAEELTQTAFVHVWQKLTLFRGESAFGSWLHRLAVNIVLTDIRSTQRREARVVGTADPAIWESAGNAPTPGLRLDLERAVAALPAQARAVFVLHAIEGYSHDDIAGLLGVAVGTSKAQLHRARQLLQEALR
jgi:RNA polymerase sigma-70 factor (ECF subfamily)